MYIEMMNNDHKHWHITIKTSNSRYKIYRWCILITKWIKEKYSFTQCILHLSFRDHGPNDIPAGVLSALPPEHRADITLSRDPGRKNRRCRGLKIGLQLPAIMSRNGSRGREHLKVENDWPFWNTTRASYCWFCSLIDVVFSFITEHFWANVKTCIDMFTDNSPDL